MVKLFNESHESLVKIRRVDMRVHTFETYLDIPDTDPFLQDFTYPSVNDLFEHAMLRSAHKVFGKDIEVEINNTRSIYSMFQKGPRKCEQEEIFDER